MDITRPNKEAFQFPECDWIEFYINVEESIAPEPIGKSIEFYKFVDNGHVYDKCTP